VKNGCNDITRQNILAKMSGKSLLTPRREMNFNWSKIPYIEHCSRKEKSGITWLLAGVWKLKGISRNVGKGRCPLCLGEEDVIHILLDCLEIINWRRKFIIIVTIVVF
jgi:hypothetical protein